MLGALHPMLSPHHRTDVIPLREEIPGRDAAGSDAQSRLIGANRKTCCLHCEWARGGAAARALYHSASYFYCDVSSHASDTR